MAAEPVLHQRTKHIGIKFQYTNENIANGTVKNAWVPSANKELGGYDDEGSRQKPVRRTLSAGDGRKCCAASSGLDQDSGRGQTTMSALPEIHDIRRCCLTLGGVLKFGSTSFYMCDLTLLYWKVHLYLPLHFM